MPRSAATRPALTLSRLPREMSKRSAGRLRGSCVNFEARYRRLYRTLGNSARLLFGGLRRALSGGRQHPVDRLEQLRLFERFAQKRLAGGVDALAHVGVVMRRDEHDRELQPTVAEVGLQVQPAHPLEMHVEDQTVQRPGLVRFEKQLRRGER